MIRNRRETVDTPDIPSVLTADAPAAAEERVYPEAVSPAGAAEGSFAPAFAWYVIVTRAHQEHKVCDLLTERRRADILRVYLPERTTVNAVRGGRVERLPLLRCRVFVYGARRAIDAFLADCPYAASLQRDHTARRIMTVPEAEMECFIEFNRHDVDRLLVLERPYRRYLFDPAKGRANVRARVIDGPFAGLEGLLVRVRKDHRLVFRIGEMAVSIPNVWQWHLLRLTDADAADERRRTDPAYLIDRLTAALQRSGLTHETGRYLIWAVRRLQTEASLGRLCAEAAANARIEPAPWQTVVRAFSALTGAEAEALTSLSYYFSLHPDELDRRPADTPLRPFLTPVTDAADAEMTAEAAERPAEAADLSAEAAEMPADAAEMPAGAAERPEVMPPAEGMEASAPVRLLPHAEDGFTELIGRLTLTEDAYRAEDETARPRRVTYETHVGRRGTLLFIDCQPLADRFLRLSPETRQAQRKTLRQYHPALAAVFETMRAAMEPEKEPLAETKAQPALRRLIFHPDTAPRWCLTLDTADLPPEAAYKRFVTEAAALLTAIARSTHLALWRDVLPELWLR